MATLDVRLFSSALMRTVPVTVVMPSGDNMFYIDQPDPHNLYGAFIGEELVELTRRMFPLSRRREDTAEAGVGSGNVGL